MSILSGLIKERVFKKIDGGYKKVSRDTDASTVYFDDGDNLNEKLDTNTEYIYEQITAVDSNNKSSIFNLRSDLNGTVLWEYDPTVNIDYCNEGYENININNINSYDYFDIVYGDGYYIRCQKTREDMMLISRKIPTIINGGSYSSNKLYYGFAFSQIVFYFDYTYNTPSIENQIHIRIGYMWLQSTGTSLCKYVMNPCLYNWINSANHMFCGNIPAESTATNVWTVYNNSNEIRIKKIIGYKNLITTPISYTDDEPPLPSD